MDIWNPVCQNESETTIMDTMYLFQLFYNVMTAFEKKIDISTLLICNKHGQSF